MQLGSSERAKESQVFVRGFELGAGFWCLSQRVLSTYMGILAQTMIVTPILETLYSTRWLLWTLWVCLLRGFLSESGYLGVSEIEGYLILESLQNKDPTI